MKNINRRDFLKTTVLGSVSLALWQSTQFLACSETVTPSACFTGSLTSFAILNDCANLTRAANLVSNPVASLIAADFNLPIPANLSRMGILVKAPISQVEAMLKKMHLELDEVNREIDLKQLQKEAKINPMELKDKTERKMALLIGAYMARGIRNTLLPLYQKQAAGDNLPVEMSIYHDMFVLRQIAGAVTANHADETGILALFNGMVPRMIARTHTLTPDYDDGPGWTLRITDWRDKTSALLAQYARVYARPDAQKSEKYIHEISFYEPSDEIIQMARSYSMEIEPDQLQHALSSGSKSLYAQALVHGINGLLEADRLLRL